MLATHSTSIGAEVAFDQIRCPTALAFDRRRYESATAHPDKTGRRRQPRDAFAANPQALGRKLDPNARSPIGAMRGGVRRSNLAQQGRILLARRDGVCCAYA
jgi:hypothetical protein